MKINLKTNTYIIATAIIYCLLLIASVIFKIDRFKLRGYSNYLFYTFIEVSYFILLVYLVSFLKYLGEKKSVIIIFTIFIIYDVSAFLYVMFAKPAGNNIAVSFTVGIVSLIISTLLMIYMFAIKTAQFATPFRFFGSAFVFIFLFKIFGTLLIIQHYSMAVLPYMALVELLIPLAIFNILFKVHNYLQKQQTSVFVNNGQSIQNGTNNLM